jgi:hypothetical protein
MRGKEVLPNMRLDQFSDNNDIVYSVSLEAVTDITAPLTRLENVTKRQVREMFQKFILASPELWGRAREDQIFEFNQERRKCRRPWVSPEILRDLEIKVVESSTEADFESN